MLYQPICNIKTELSKMVQLDGFFSDLTKFPMNPFTSTLKKVYENI